ncbi:winged helix-turn-helix transcriptional regulator [Mycobacterium sp. SM1]|uniref:ArsR/SmtB family transcription factor n=1 Tax=Mycobacterium sp. SM1 TaxID=2816243 RepID=UPI001BD1A5D1|nr:metalloregulator ArsR/SmtB family transcription factor [Mycobacterium sp. SM1]MBS4729495.1 winged helix-turn-helix transcriptional regulator [Mycobacterium sp. SM1]
MDSRTEPLLTDPIAAGKVAETLQALASPTRLRILTRLRQSPCSVTELAAAVGMEQPAVSHQLRLLRNLGLVAGDRSGRNIVYRLYDNHVAALLDEAVYHSEHLRLGVSDTFPHPINPTRQGRSGYRREQSVRR